MIRQADDAKEGLMELGEINMVTSPRPLAAAARAPAPPASAPPPPTSGDATARLVYAWWGAEPEVSVC